MSYKKEHFSKCVFNPLEDGSMIEKINEIISPDWTQDPWLDQICRYVIMVYDPKSPLVINERDLSYRKGLAADLAGLDMDDQDLMSSVYNCSRDFVPPEDREKLQKIPTLAELIVKYLVRFAKSKEWAAIVVFEHCFWESAKKLMEPIEGKDSKAQLESVQKKAAIKDEIDKDIKRLDMYYKVFLGEDVELEKKVKDKFSPEKVGLKR